MGPSLSLPALIKKVLKTRLMGRRKRLKTGKPGSKKVHPPSAILNKQLNYVLKRPSQSLEVDFNWESVVFTFWSNCVYLSHQIHVTYISLWLLHNEMGKSLHVINNLKTPSLCSSVIRVHFIT